MAQNKDGGKESTSNVVQSTSVQTLGWEDPLEKGKATHSSILAYPWGRKESDMTEQLSLTQCQYFSIIFMNWNTETEILKYFLVYSSFKKSDWKFI